MNVKNTNIIMQNKIFGWLALGTSLILIIAFVAMQLSRAMNWDETDFIVVAILLFGTGSLFVLTARHIRSVSHRILAGIGFLLVLAYIWAELAVGIFTNWGS